MEAPVACLPSRGRGSAPELSPAQDGSLWTCPGPQPVPQTSPTCRCPRAPAGLGQASPRLQLQQTAESDEHTEAPAERTPWVPVGSQRPRGPGKALRSPVSCITAPAAPDLASTLPPAAREAHGPEFPEPPAPRPWRLPSSVSALRASVCVSIALFCRDSSDVVRASPRELAPSRPLHPPGLCARPRSEALALELQRVNFRCYSRTQDSTLPFHSLVTLAPEPPLQRSPAKAGARSSFAVACPAAGAGCGGHLMRLLREWMNGQLGRKLGCHGFSVTMQWDVSLRWD